MSEPKGTFDTDELVVFLEMNLYVPKSDAARAIIARLRAADKLCEILKEEAEFRGVPELDKAIADYEGEK